MPEAWYFARAETVTGPVTTSTLAQLAAEGRLAPTDLVWPEGQSRALAGPAQNVVYFPDTSLAGELVPDWLDDVRRAEAAESSASPEAAPAVVAPPLATPVVTVERLVPEAPDPGRLVIGGATARGTQHERNEDSFLVVQTSWTNLDRLTELAVVAVADGAGQKGGERASGLVVSALARALAPVLGDAIRASFTQAKLPLADTLGRAFQDAHQSVSQTARVDPLCSDLRATAAAVVIRDDEVHVGLVGDSRVYHLRQGRVEQVLRDPAAPAGKGKSARTENAQPEAPPSMGQGQAIEPARFQLQLTAGDWLVIGCSCFCAHVKERQLPKALAEQGASPVRLARYLVDLARRRGSSDDCTVVAVYRG
jgi:serine/threonine protein phosphatase PrpC